MNRLFIVALLLLLALPLSSLAAVRSLSLGSSGADVTTLQKELIAQGYLTGSATGYFGAATQAAVQKFQCARKIICAGDAVSGYGIAGAKTQAALANAGPAQPVNISGPLTAAAKGAFEISGWVPDWRAATATADVSPHLSQMTSVMPFGYKVVGGVLKDHSHITETPWPEFIAAAKAKKVRVIPTVVWGDGADMQNVLSSAAMRVALEDAIANMVKQNGFDGVDIDFEAKKAETKTYFSTFLKGLYQRLGNKWMYCTIEARMPLADRYSPGAAIPPDATDYANDYVAMNKYCDRVEIMAYDQGTIDVRLNTARSAPYAPVADPGWVSNLVSLAAQSISRNKLIIGLATYGYEYTVTPQPDGSYQYKRLWAFNPKYASDIAAQLGISPARTSAGELGFTYNASALAAIAPTNGDVMQTQQVMPATSVAQNLGSQINTTQPFNYVTWSDAQAMADKVKLAHDLGVRGVAVFSLGGAEDQGMWSVLK